MRLFQQGRLCESVVFGVTLSDDGRRKYLCANSTTSPELQLGLDHVTDIYHINFTDGHFSCFMLIRVSTVRALLVMVNVVMISAD